MTRPKTRKMLMTQGISATIDDADYEMLSKFSWWPNKVGESTYAITKIGRRTLQMHRVIMNTGLFTDHIDGNTLNNTRKNLRICTPSESAMNRGSVKGSTSKYCGVHWSKGHKKWIAQINNKGKCRKIGGFDCEKEAAKAYDREAKKAYGKFARPNFPEDAS